jgi:hypothetical protein
MRECRRIAARRVRVGLRPSFALLAGIVACHADEPSLPEPPPIVEAAHCEPGPVPAAFAPGIDATLEQAEPWIASAIDPDRVLLDAAQLAALRERDRGRTGFARDPWDVAAESEQLLREATAMLEGWAQSELVTEQPHAIARALEIVANAQPVDHARLVVVQTQLYCTPLVGALLRAPFDPEFDRNLCTTLHPGELLRVLARADAGRWLLVDAGHTVGWVHPESIGPRLSESDRITWRTGERVLSLRDDVRTQGGVPVRVGVGLPLVRRDDAGIRVRIATAEGLGEDALAASSAVTIGPHALTRRDVLATIFAQIGAPYGWGGRDGGRDCSQLLRDVLVPFGVALPRHSSLQAVAGTTSIDVTGLSEADKLAAIDLAAQHGLVLLYMPGHIMLDIGVHEGKRFAISSIAEFLVPCADGLGDTLYGIDRVAVTDLEVGRGSARGAFVERITTLAVLGPG